MVLSSSYEVFSGQVVSRVTGSEELPENKMFVLNPAAIGYGLIDHAKLTVTYAKNERAIKKLDYLGKLASGGDIVMELAAPYEAAMVGDLSGEPPHVVPSYCCLIRQTGKDIPPEYLCALLNSEIVRRRLLKKQSGAATPVLRIEDIRMLDIPVPAKARMEDIGSLFMDVASLQLQTDELARANKTIVDMVISRELEKTRSSGKELSELLVKRERLEKDIREVDRRIQKLVRGLV